MNPIWNDKIRQLAANEGFNACHFAIADTIDPDDKLGQWLHAGYHADMDWMESTKAIRQDPKLKLPEAQSVVVLALNYYAEDPERPPKSGKIALYARGKDYHKVITKKLIRIAREMDAMQDQAKSYVAVDSGPVMERSWAERSGLGWIGKNSLVLRQDLGSWFFLGTILTTLKLQPDSPVANHCGTCRACIEACPTDAFVADGILDANKCISYQTIENRYSVPDTVANNMGDWLFGCDICQQVCPWNRFAKTTEEKALLPRPGLAFPIPDEMLEQDEAAFNHQFAGTPVRRTKHAGMQRNAHIALKNQQKD